MVEAREEIDSAIIDLAGIPLDRLRSSDDSALTAAVLRAAKEAVEPSDVAAAFQNRCIGGI
ncbi:hypothetical protein GCM10029963_24690 [Micromonospora andamanensis]|uniref:FXSXX-COOH protein n=1 Tax=Micromonospora andamanensis TaxID=1287068 RepID=A0ABQ4I5R5_9ACTN|nr:hypothetical protein Van01_64610 [Micromonospora andamanensis]GIJ38354.1 hypothetical protein Vwe01_16790 [Micromonospora andamanensis]